VVLDKDSANNKVDYLNGDDIDNKLRQTNSTIGSLYFIQDHLNSTIALSGTNGNVTEQLNYESFGENLNSSLTRFTYTGREKDSITGLMYYRARWYDQKQGRFLSEDPIGFSGGVNFYRYVDNEPINNIDPEGLHKGDKWYGYNDSDFHKWYHRCYKRRGGPKQAGAEEIAEANQEWVNVGSPKGGRCGGSSGQEPEQIPEKERCRGRERNRGRGFYKVPFAPPGVVPIFGNPPPPTPIDVVIIMGAAIGALIIICSRSPQLCGRLIGGGAAAEVAGATTKVDCECENQ
jgi:RHS repeat-associated protein